MRTAAAPRGRHLDHRGGRVELHLSRFRLRVLRRGSPVIPTIVASGRALGCAGSYDGFAVCAASTSCEPASCRHPRQVHRDPSLARHRRSSGGRRPLLSRLRSSSTSPCRPRRTVPLAMVFQAPTARSSRRRDVVSACTSAVIIPRSRSPTRATLARAVRLAGTENKIRAPLRAGAPRVAIARALAMIPISSLREPPADLDRS